MEIVDGTSPMVKKAPEDTWRPFPLHHSLTLSSLAVTFLYIISLSQYSFEITNPLVTLTRVRHLGISQGFRS
jgi:hypothetical protein